MIENSSKPVVRCQISNSNKLKSIIFLGYLPPVNTLRKINSIPVEEKSFPAELLYCDKSKLAQLGCIVDKKILFPYSYPYTSSTTKILREKERVLAQQQEQQKLADQDLQAQKQSIQSKEENYRKKLEEVDKKRAEADEMLANQISQLEKIANLSAAEAREQIMEALKSEAESKASSLVKQAIEEAKLTATKEAKKIVIETIQRTAAENAIENCVSVFNIESDDVKGKIIGR